MALILTKRLSRKNQETQASTDLFLCAGWENLALSDDSRFDVAVMAAFIEHFPQPQKVLERIARYLPTGGQIILTTPSPRIARLHRLGAAIGLFSAEGAEEHEKLLDRDDLLQIAHSAELEVRTYHRFCLGCNQLCVLGKTHSQI